MTKQNHDPAAHHFDAEDALWQYRFAHDQGDKATLARLRKQWAECQGVDSLHESALGQPIEPAALAERVKRNKREILRVIKRRETLEAEVAWLEHALKGDSCARAAHGCLSCVAAPGVVSPCGSRKAA